MNEPDITIYGIKITQGMAMAIRVACTNMHAELMHDPNMLGDDEFGRELANSYLKRIIEVLKVMRVEVPDE